MIEQLKPHLKGKENLIKLMLLLTGFLGVYLLIAWASYSPLDNAWSVASSITQTTLNKTGHFGAWSIDMLYAMFGKVAVLVPIALIIFSIYSLGMGLSVDMKWKTVFIRLASFLLLMVGLAGLFSVLFSNSAYYLSGGFVGGVWETILSDTIGQFGALLIAMLFTIAGLYFCSVQSLLPILTQFYEWIMAKSEESKTAESLQHLQNTEQKQPLVTENEAVEVVDDHKPQFTDISAFKRPNIGGLRHSENVEIDNREMYEIERDLELPTINILIQPDMVNQVAEQATSGYELPNEESNVLQMPTIRLNTAIENEVDTIENSSSLEDLKIAESMLPQTQLDNDIEDTEEAIDDVREITPEFMVTPPKAMKDVSEQPAYPKGYGDTLIHPLLQRKVITEKPTTPLPTLDLLDKAPIQSQQITEQEIRETSVRLEAELANFGVKATVEDVLVGPVVTRYEIQPAAGVKASKITNLASDIARGLMFKAIRITEVIPNKPYMGIETPNKHRETVWLRDVLDSDEFRNTTATLPMALGKDISGEPVVVDMAKMPHLLVAGQTGGGKSVGVNTMILSLLFKLTPEQVRFIMIDPKVVELSIYNDIPHLLTPVVTDMKKAANALRWAVEEMERRYLLVSHLQVRNIEGYNAKIDQAAAMNLPIPDPTWRPGDSMDSLPPPLQKLSYIVLIVDEFADLMMSAGKEVEEYIMRIAQKARAVGIHLILATQRPSTDVITGVIKANIPSRIAFTVASQIDSRTILDSGGAEALLGRGDMLYSGAGSPDIIRIHGAFMKDEEVQRVADNWRARRKPNYLESIVESRSEEADGKNDGGTGDLDPLFDEVVEYITETGSVSISNIQRRFSLGFNRAARIVDQMEAQGIVSEPLKGGKREVLAR
ncbi:TPA: DNA translocase FtsK 4TM domain-containing protein [Mannheimia haemolytica]|uniref:DNA translocase FtsK n=2 Tax=Mannheimia haemolytica TaxID=75985 RepID=A0A378NBN4_MANHA|nr:DNA translocase FtsK [Mannheimia haemolytica]AGQ37719.1 cell division protein FtsK [Mannheimia haemolytica D171]EEY13456.1 cell division protein FtsK [Mannheimia haemolytica serotype A2 str. BOVINE]KYL09596.1 cell division protein FtsK [Mannheimia haemolytica]KYL14185.1 cell division protein FtsK [Mannheimia haemolytica]KYL23732.1 cell division protein FtsK [Mannheimia haemolytica]